MANPINKKTLEHLAELSRIELDKKNEDKLLKDLQKILEYFEELGEVDTENIEPLAGGTPVLSEAEGIGKNVFREDTKNNKLQTANDKLTGAFPEQENGYLKIPPVFN